MENNTWKKYTEKPNEGDYILVFSAFSGVHAGWYRNGIVETDWSHGEKFNWDEVNKWMRIPEITVF